MLEQVLVQEIDIGPGRSLQSLETLGEKALGVCVSQGVLFFNTSEGDTWYSLVSDDVFGFPLVGEFQRTRQFFAKQ